MNSDYKTDPERNGRKNYWLNNNRLVIFSGIVCALAASALLTCVGRKSPASYSVLEATDWVDTNSHKGNPQADTVFQVNRRLYRFENIKGKLDDLPDDEQLSNGEIFITLPFESTFLKFKIFPSQIMSPELKAKFPSIKAYKGIAIADPSIVANFTSSDDALYVMISSPNGSEFIDSIPGNSNLLLKSRTPSAYGISTFSEEGMPERTSSAKLDSIIDPRDFVIIKRTFRIAISATYEYTQYHNGKKNALLAIVATLANVNQTYERELGISFTLVGDNDKLIFENSEDNFSNEYPEKLIFENQSLLDKVIGNSNYDLGHVFSTSSGLAPGFLCDPATKAQGASGLKNPIGSPFDIDYVAHEIGHQLGANHIFNGSTCPFRNPTTAVEPGSGSTIMGYAGICKEQDLQHNSNSYFNALNLYEIDRFLQGVTCGKPESTTNHNPQAKAERHEINVPVKTPFFLYGSGFDSDNDSLRYCWEQNDVNIGLGSAPDFESINTPNYRSYPPSMISMRYFPTQEDLVTGQLRIGEIVPKQERDIHFILTVRDFKGGFDFDNTIVHIRKGKPFKITSPVNPTTWQAGSRQSIKWDVAKTNNPPFSCDKVNILLSLDGGISFSLTLASQVKNDGSEDIVIPTLDMTDNPVRACIKIEAIGQNFYAISTDILQISK